MTNLEKLETAIRQALPELMELKPINYSYRTGLIKGENGELSLHTSDNVHFETCTNITILHLLRWLDKSDRIYRMDADGELFDVTGFDNVKFGYLDLSKPLLKDQSEEVIDELVKLIP